MKTILMARDFSYRLWRKNAFVQYREGQRYERVPEVQARAILAADAGKVVEEGNE